MSFSFGFGGGGGGGSDGGGGGGSMWGAGAPLHYEAAAAKRAAAADEEAPAPRQRRRTAAHPGGPPPDPPPAPGSAWPAWRRPPPAADRRTFGLEGKSYCWSPAEADSRAADGRARVRQLLRDGSVGPAVGWRGDDGDLSLAPGEWSGELLDAVTIPAAGAEPAAPSAGAAAAAGIAALQKGEPWTIASAVDSATVAAARKEVDELLRTGRLRSSNHGQQSAVRDDKVGFFSLTGGDDDEGNACPSALGRCFAQLVALASLRGVATAVTGGAPLLLPPVGMLAVYDGNRSKYVAHVDNDLVTDEISGEWHWRNARVLTAILYLNPCEGSDAGEREGDQERHWEAADGGALRCWPSFHSVAGQVGDGPSCIEGSSSGEAPCSDAAVDVLPVGGTVVMFDSRRLRHAVRPAHRRRVALSAWFVSPATIIEETEAEAERRGEAASAAGERADGGGPTE